MKMCFSNIVDGICEVSSLRKMSKVTQAQCCCSVDTNAWGKDCTPCPKPNTRKSFVNLPTRWCNNSLHVWAIQFWVEPSL